MLLNTDPENAAETTLSNWTRCPILRIRAIWHAYGAGGAITYEGAVPDPASGLAYTLPRTYQQAVRWTITAAYHAARVLESEAYSSGMDTVSALHRYADKACACT